MDTREEFSYVFHFLDDHTLQVVEDGQDVGQFELTSSGLLLQTVLALSWYVENTMERHCDDRLLLLLGRHLFQFLFTGGRQDPPDRAALTARFIDRCRHSTPVRISLHFKPEAREYAQLPWEFLAVPLHGVDADEARHVADMNLHITLARHTPAQGRVQRASKLRVLVATYSGSDQAEISSDLLHDQLSKIQTETDGDFTFQMLRDDEASWRGIEAALNAFQPDVFHFSGHGERNALWLANETEREEFTKGYLARTPLGFGVLKGAADDFRATVDGIAKLFDGYRPQLVILDACSSDWSWLSEMLPGVAHQLVETIPAVIAMRYPIANGSAEQFAVDLYGAIVEGRPLDEAVQYARYRLIPKAAEHSHRAFGTPVLYLRDSERMCEPLVGPNRMAANPPKAPPQPCPRCGTLLWSETAHYCVRCAIVFRCRNVACEAHARGYSKEEITYLAGRACPYCTESYVDIPRWVAQQQEEPAADQSRHASEDSFGGFRAVG